MEKIFVWYIPTKDKYYHKVGKGTYIYDEVGQINQYGHKLVYIIDLDYFLDKNKNGRFVSYKKMLINDLIRFLEKCK